MILTANDIYMANSKDYLKAHPRQREELIKLWHKNKPESCLNCYFFKWETADKVIPTCAIGGELEFDLNLQFGRDKSCPCEKGEGHD